MTLSEKTSKVQEILELRAAIKELEARAKGKIMDLEGEMFPSESIKIPGLGSLSKNRDGKDEEIVIDRLVGLITYEKYVKISSVSVVKARKELDGDVYRSVVVETVKPGNIVVRLD